jgi:hypothetical protein
MTKQTGSCSKKVRGMAQRSLDLRTAVNTLQTAKASGTTRLIGRHAHEAILAAAFGRWRRSRAPP